MRTLSGGTSGSESAGTKGAAHFDRWQTEAPSPRHIAESTGRDLQEFGGGTPIQELNLAAAHTSELPHEVRSRRPRAVRGGSGPAWECCKHPSWGSLQSPHASAMISPSRLLHHRSESFKVKVDKRVGDSLSTAPILLPDRITGRMNPDDLAGNVEGLDLWSGLATD